MKFYHDILATRQQRVLRRLGRFLTAQSFYLAGGSAIALQLGHRRSVDLDWFTAKPMGAPARLAEQIQQHGVPFATELEDEGTLHGTVGGVRVSLLEFPYPFLRPPVYCKAFDCRLASCADLAAMKLSAVATRGAKKDFVDVYALGMRSFPLLKMLGWYQEKFSVSEFIHVLNSLTYFKDADKQQMPRMLWDTNWRTIKKTIQGWVEELAQRDI